MGHSLFIASTTDTLSIFGDLHLHEANVQGKGTILMIATQSHCIVAHQSSISTLIINNLDTVSLVGELHIHTGLLLQRGVFDTRQGYLRRSDTAWLRTLPTAHWCSEQDAAAAPLAHCCWSPLLPFALPPSSGAMACWGVPPDVAAALNLCSSSHSIESLVALVSHQLAASSQDAPGIPDPPPRPDVYLLPPL